MVLGALACGRGPARATDGEQRDLHVIAHPDDDLLFMNPAVADEIRSGHHVHTVVLTAGDGGDAGMYWRQRELGLMAAYASMAHVPNMWRQVELPLVRPSPPSFVLEGAPGVQLTFVGLPDGALHGDGFPRHANASLGKLWTGKLRELESVDGRRRYSRKALINLLRQIISDVNPTTLHTLDGTGRHGRDHADHQFSARFAWEASRREHQPNQLMGYRGYNIGREPANLASTVAQDKWSTFLDYARYDNHLCRGGGTSCLARSPYRLWSAREYRTEAPLPEPTDGRAP